MKIAHKIALVAVGYLLAILVAAAAVSIYYAATSGPERQAADGMHAFGDALLFLAVFGLASAPATGAALFFLRRVRRFWPALAVVALAIAATGLAALFAYFAWPTAIDGSMLHAWATLSPIRVLVAPPFALVFLLSGLFAPSRPARIALFLAAAVEAMVFASVVFQWLQPFRAP